MERARREAITWQEVGISRPVTDSAALWLYCRGLVLVGLLALALAGPTPFEVAYSGRSGATAPRRWAGKGS